MTRFVVDASAVLHIVTHDIRVSDAHTLLAPTLIRSQVLSVLHEATTTGDVTPAEAKVRLARFAGIPIRLLGDSVLRRRAWTVADQLGWSATFNAEYVALTQLQGDFLVTVDTELARSVEGVVPLASIDDLVRP
jgi:predicted nucleic acid-binding protein